MKNNLKLHLAGLLLLCTTATKAQVAISDVTIKDHLYLVYYEHTDGMHTVTFKENGEEKHKTSIPNFTPAFLFKQLTDIYCPIAEPNCTLPDSIGEDLREKASTLFIDLLYTYANQEETLGQHIANVELKTKIPVYIDLRFSKLSDTSITVNEEKLSKFSYGGRTNNPAEKIEISIDTLKRRILPNKKILRFKDTFTPKECQLVFEDGFITSVIISGKYNNKKAAFSSQYPIGITTRGNIKKLNGTRLFNELGNTDSYLLLGEVINYERLTDVLTKDYSPKNAKVILNMESRNKALYKAPVSKLFRLNIFSDLVGINEDNPNGLVQLELDKRINLNSNRMNLWKGGLSGLTHLTPYFVWSKIEENNRELPLSTFIDTALKTQVNYVSPLEIYRYSMLKTGMVLNVVDFYWPAVDLQINAVSGLTFTQLVDSTQGSNPEKERINSPLLGGELKLIFLPEKTFGFALSSNSFYYWNLNANTQFNSINGTLDKKELIEPQRWLHDLALLISIRTGIESDNMFFARVGILHEWSNLNNNFAQIQLGYSMYLKTSKK